MNRIMTGLTWAYLSLSVVGNASPGETTETPDIAALYSRHCSLCHGDEGYGDGPGSLLLWPSAKDFSRGTFEIVSTMNGVPTDDDLARTIRDGMPGSAMPPFEWLSGSEVRGLAAYVRELAIRGKVRRMAQLAERRGATFDSTAARESAASDLVPGEPIPTPTDTDPSAGELGRTTYERDCAACHGSDGKGRKLQDIWSDTEYPWARDFTSGLIQGGATREDIHRRILAGMPGAGMPPSRFDSPRTAAAVVDHVLSLIPEGAVERRTRRRQTLVTVKTEAAPDSPDDPRWSEVPGLDIAVTPLRWNEHAIAEVHVQAMADSETIAIRMRWEDPTRDDHPLSGAAPDGVGLQLSNEDSPPLFGMGSKDHPVNLWHWRAHRPEDIIGLFDLTAPAPHRYVPMPPTGSVSDVPVYVPAGGALQSTAGARAAHGEGIPKVGAGVSPRLSIASSAQWNEGIWEVVLLRGREPRSEEEVSFVEGGRVRFAVGVWNGSLGDRGPRKSISVWQELRLE